MKLLTVSSIVLAQLVGVSSRSMDVDTWPSVENDHSKLQIMLPESLQKKDGYVHKDALFGYPGYSMGSLQTQLIYLNQSACEDFTKGDWETPFALLIDRGDCVFVEKVRRAQHVGARAVIVADNKCLCSDSDCLRDTGDTNCETVLPFMNDDESGGDITIPSMLIRKTDGDAIKNAISHSKGISNVLVKFDWGIPSPDGRVEWTMWHSSWDEQSAVTLKEIESIVDALGDRAFFTPRFATYNGTRVGCYDKDNNNTPCGNMCINSGRYCLLDPSPFHDRSEGASGSDVVIENLRRICIWNITSKEDAGIGKKWWRYVNDFDAECNSKEDTFIDKNCVLKIIKRYDIDVNEIEKCMQPYGLDIDEVNPLLESDLKDQTELELLRLPALFVDGVHARGRIDANGVLNMICAGYGAHNPPNICSCSNQNPLALVDCVKVGGNMSANGMKNGVSFGTLIFLLTLIGMGVSVGGFVYWRRSQRHMREQVRSILAEYMPLEDQSDEYDLSSPRLHPAMIAAAKSPRGFLPTKEFVDDLEN